MVNDVLSDMVARINNAQMAKLTHATAIKSKLNLGVLEILKQEGFIESYAEDKDNLGTINIDLKYDGDKPIISFLKRVSKPGRRVYSKITNLPKYFNGLGVAILSTPKGVVTDKTARQLNVGGEILCVIF